MQPAAKAQRKSMKSGSARKPTVVVSASGLRPTPTSESAPSRRELLAAAGAALVAAGAASLVAPPPASALTATVEVPDLGLIQKQSQLREFRERAEAALKEVLTAADAPATMRLVLHDAATYDAATKTGGLDGSIVLVPEELERPENVDLKPLVERLAQAKAKIDAAGEADGSGPISWADTIVLASKVAAQQQWFQVKLSRAKLASGGAVIAGPAFGAAWPVRLGREDRAVAGPAGRVPAAGAPVAEIKATLATLGVKPGQAVGTGIFGGPRPPFWERPTLVLWTAAAADPAAEEDRFVAEDAKAFEGAKKNYDRSRRTITRTDYEVDFVDYWTELVNLGATFRKDAYLHPEVVNAIRL